MRALRVSNAVEEGAPCLSQGKPPDIEGSHREKFSENYLSTGTIFRRFFIVTDSNSDRGKGHGGRVKRRGFSCC